MAQRESEGGREGSLGAGLQAQVGTHSMGEPHLPPRAALWSCPLRRRPRSCVASRQLWPHRALIWGVLAGEFSEGCVITRSGLAVHTVCSSCRDPSCSFTEVRLEGINRRMN